MEMTKNDDDNSKKGVGNKLTYLGPWEVARLMVKTAQCLQVNIYVSRHGYSNGKLVFPTSASDACFSGPPHFIKFEETKYVW